MINYAHAEDKAQAVSADIIATGGETLVIQADVQQRGRRSRHGAGGLRSLGASTFLWQMRGFREMPPSSR